MLRPRVRIALYLSLMAALALAVACSRSDPAEDSGTVSTPTARPLPTPTPTPINPEALLRESGAVMEGLSSFHFQLSHKAGGTALLPNLIIDEATGDVIKPDKISTDFSGVFSGFAIKSSLVTVGETSFMTNPITGLWESVPRDVSPLGFFDPQQGIASMLAEVRQPTLMKAGKAEYRVRGTLAAEALAPLVGETIAGATVEVDVVIDGRTLYLKEAVFKGRAKAAEPDEVVRVITLSRFNEPLSIEAP